MRAAAREANGTGGPTQCRQVQPLLRAHLAELDARLADLRGLRWKLKRALDDYERQLASRSDAECPVVHDVARDTRRPNTRRRDTSTRVPRGGGRVATQRPVPGAAIASVSSRPWAVRVLRARFLRLRWSCGDLRGRRLETRRIVFENAGGQEIFANFVSGLLLLMERPVRVGDTITVGGVTGTVTRIRIRATTIQDWDLKELVVPNKDLVTGHLLNWTLSDAANRVTVFVGVAYGSDVEKVTRVLQEIVAATALVLEAPEPKVTFEEFGDSALKFSIRAYVREVEDRLPAIHALHTAIAKRFGEEDIEIAFPQMDIHVRSTAPHLRNDPPRPLRLASPSG